METDLRDIYDRILATWEVEKNHLFGGACGFSILGSKPRQKPPLMVVGENAGFSAKDAEGEAHVELTWPCTSYLEGEEWVLKTRMRSLFQQAGRLDVLREAVFTNFNFFKSGSISRQSAYRWVDVDRKARQRVEATSIRELRQLIHVIRPRNIMVLGMAGFDRHARDTSTVLRCSSGRRRLVATGELWSTSAFAVMHPSGARWSENDNQIAAHWLRQHLSDHDRTTRTGLENE